MNVQVKNALQYIRNTGGNVTRRVFVVDHEPVGESLCRTIIEAGLARTKGDGRLTLTSAGEFLLGGGVENVSPKAVSDEDLEMSDYVRASIEHAEEQRKLLQRRATTRRGYAITPTDKNQPNQGDYDALMRYRRER